MSCVTTLLCIILILIMTFMKETCQRGIYLMSDFLLVMYLCHCFDESVNQFQFVPEPNAKEECKNANVSVQIMM